MTHVVIDARNRRSSTGRYTDRLMHHIQSEKSNYCFSVLVQPDDPWTPSSSDFKRVPCPYKQFSLNPLEQLLFAILLYRLKANLVHFTMPQQPLLYFRKKVTTIHDLTFFRYPRRKNSNVFAFRTKMFLYGKMFWAVARYSKKIIVPSEFVKADVIARTPELGSKIAVTHEASEPPIKVKAASPASVAKPFILHVGSPFPHKNIERLLDAFTELKQSHPNLQLVLAGKKEFYFNQLENRVASHPNKEDIIITGFVSDGELKWLYENAECYVLPSLSEGFGLPGLEAMVHGCALVSSNATCLPEVYGDAAHYFDPESTEDMALKIDELLKNKPLRARLIKAGYKQVKKYSWQKMAKETLEIYKKSV